MRLILKEFHEGSGSKNSKEYDPTERMKPLDVVKVMMGVYSDRVNIKRFMNNGRFWAKHQEYDYENLYQVAEATVKDYYLDLLTGAAGETGSKKRRLNEA